MVDLPLWIKPYRAAGALNSLVAPTRFVDEHVFQTKQNCPGIVLEAAGMDDETPPDQTLEARLGRIRAAFAAFGEHWRIYQYAIRQTDATVAVSDSYPDAIVRDTVRRRAAFLENEARLATIRLVYVLLLEPPASNAGESFSQKRILRVLADELAYNTAIALNSARSFVDQIGDLLGLRMLDKREAFAFFRLLVNLDPEIASAESLRQDEHVDFFLPSLPIERTYQRGRLSGISIGDADLAVLTVREYPRETFPRILRDVLRIDGNFIVASEFKRVSTEAAVKAIRTAERHHFWSQWDFLSLVKSRGKRDDIIVDKAEARDVEELGGLLTRVKNDGEYVGEFSITVVLYGWGGLQPLRRAAVEFQKTFADHEGSAVQETYNALNT